MTATRSSWTWLIMLWSCWRNSCPSSTSTQHDCLYESCSTLVLRCDEPRTGGRQGLAPTRLGGALMGLVSAPTQPTRRLQIFAAAHITWFTSPLQCMARFLLTPCCHMTIMVPITPEVPIQNSS